MLIFAIASFTISAGVLIYAIVEEVKWAKNKEEIRRQYISGGAESVRDYKHVFESLIFIGFIILGLYILA